MNSDSDNSVHSAGTLASKSYIGSTAQGNTYVARDHVLAPDLIAGFVTVHDENRRDLARFGARANALDHMRFFPPLCSLSSDAGYRLQQNNGLGKSIFRNPRSGVQASLFTQGLEAVLRSLMTTTSRPIASAPSLCSVSYARAAHHGM